MTGTALDPFRIRDHVADFDAIVAAFRQRSEISRARLRCETNVAYGPTPEERLDIFYPAALPAALAATPAPVNIYIHCGYWRMFSKDDFSFVAETVTAAGGIAVILDYALMPQHRMAVLVEQVRKAAAWVAREIGARGGDPRRLSVMGHSAGAHLATWLLDRSSGHTAYHLRAAVLLGGLYDLAPLQQSFLQPEIHLTDEEVRRWTPLSVEQETAPHYTVLVGEQETPPFHHQATSFHAHLTAHGCAAERHVIPLTNHMTSALALGDPGSIAGHYLTAALHV